MTNEQLNRGIKYCKAEEERFKKMLDVGSPTYIGLQYSLISLLEAMKEPEEKKDYCTKCKTNHCSLDSECDPIREVYEKYKNKFNRRLKEAEGGVFEYDMWNAIKKYCEEKLGVALDR